MQSLTSTIRTNAVKRADSVRLATAPKAPVASARRGYFSGNRRSANDADATPRRRPVVRAATQPRIATREHWCRDIGFGANNRAVRDLFARTESTCDSALPDIDDYPEALENLQAEVFKLTGSHLNVGRAKMSFLWPLLNYAPRGLLDTDQPYVAYSRCAMDEARRRGGEIRFFMSGFSAHTHFANALMVERDQGMSYGDFVQSVPYAPLSRAQESIHLMDLATLEADTPPRPVTPLITSIELADIIEGRQCDDVKFFDSTGKELDPQEFRRLYNAAKDATRTASARENLPGGWSWEEHKFPLEAQAAIEAFQAYMDGDVSARKRPAGDVTVDSKPAFETSVQVRAATQSDAPQIAEFISDLDETAWNQQVGGARTLEAAQAAALELAQSCAVALDGDRVVGMGRLLDRAGSTDGEVVVVLEPGARAAGAPHALLMSYQALARSRGMTGITIRGDAAEAWISPMVLLASKFTKRDVDGEVQWHKSLAPKAHTTT